MKRYIIILCLILPVLSFSQEVIRDGKTYEVKKEKIYLDGKDITDVLLPEERQAILSAATIISANIKAEEKSKKEAEKLEKEKKKAEKAKNRAEKARKKAEKELKRKEKLQSNYEKAKRNLEKTQSKYEKLKSKGKLSPNDESNWLEKIDKLTEKMRKAQKQLNKG